MPSTALSPSPKLQFFDSTGNPLTGGKVYTYAAGTTTPLATYTDASGLTFNTNPIILDVRGEASIWLSDLSYKFVLTNASDTVIWTVDNITGIEALKASLANTTDVAKGDALIGFRQSNASGALVNAVGRTVHQKLQETISVKDFGAVGDGVTDDTAAIQSAVNAAGGKALYFPGGTYIVGEIITVLSNSSLYGDPGVTTLKLKTKTYAPANVSIFVLTNITNVYIYGLTFNGNKGNIGTTRNPINTVFQTTKVTFDTCEWINCEGICLNVSTVVDNFAVLNCRFINCGGATDNSDGYRNQAIAFSADGASRSKDIEITGNYFFAIGLDCISMTNLDNVVVSNNSAYNSYTFLFNTPTIYSTINLTVTGNVIYNTNQGALNNSVNPVAIDLPAVINATVIGNAIFDTDQAAIGIFDGSDNVVVSNNTIVNAVRKPASWCGAISVGANGAASNSFWVTVSNNIIVSGTATMTYGILLQGDLDTAFISNNSIAGQTVSKFGRYSAGVVPSPATTTALVDNSGISPSTFIQDIDAAGSIWTNWRKTNTLEAYLVDGVQVVSNRQPAIANSGNATTDAILAALRVHGLIAT
jgi:polygalacturonase